MIIETFIETYIDQNKFYTLAESQEIYDKLKELWSTDGIGMKDHAAIKKVFQSPMIMSEEIYTHFGDAQMLKLIKNKMDPIFAEMDYKTKDAPLFGHTFTPIQHIMQVSARLGFEQCFEYIVSNVAVENYDIDQLCVLSGINNHNEGILKILLENTDEKYNGSKGSLTHMVRAEMKRSPELQTLSDGMKNVLMERFDWLDIPMETMKLSIETHVARWKKMSKEELDDLVYNQAKGQYTDEEFEALKSVLMEKLVTELNILKREQELMELNSK